MSKITVQPQSLSLPMELRVPLWSWILRVYGTCVVIFLFGFSIWMLWRVQHPLGWSLFVVILFKGAIEAVFEVRRPILMAGTRITENGLERKRKRNIVFYRWEDVVRYEPYRLDFALFFKDGEKVRFLKEVKSFEEIKAFILERLEQIGTFEDGRKVPRVLPSISIKTLFWIFGAIVLVVIAIALWK